MGCCPSLSFSSHPAYSMDSCQDPPVMSQCHPGSSMVASSTMVYYPQDYRVQFPETVSPTIPPNSVWRQDLSPRHRVAPSHGVEDSSSIKEAADRARRPSAKLLYSYKQSVFTKFAASGGFVAVPASLGTLLAFLLYVICLI